MGELMRIDKLLSNMNIGSRKEVKSYIREGLVMVNGKVIEKASLKVDPKTDQIEFMDEDVIFEDYLYFMLNKPQGVISASHGYGQTTVVDLLDEKYHKRNIFPAGRLDKDTEGLVLLTNDGRLAHNLLSPKKGVEKKYYARVDGKLEENDIKRFEEGIFIEEDNYLAMPARLEIISDYQCLVYIKEGKYHQVKRMLKNCGKKVVYLKRLAIGPLVLDETLELGQYRALTDRELEALRKLTS